MRWVHWHEIRPHAQNSRCGISIDTLPVKRGNTLNVSHDFKNPFDLKAYSKMLAISKG